MFFFDEAALLSLFTEDVLTDEVREVVRDELREDVRLLSVSLSIVSSSDGVRSVEVIITLRIELVSSLLITRSLRVDELSLFVLVT